MILFILSVVFFLIAFVYASVGMGGGTAYLAAMAIMGLPPSLLPPMALSCNTLVSASALYHFYRTGNLRMVNVVPFLCASIPAAYVGGVLEINDNLFRILLAGSLALSGILMIFKKESFEKRRALDWKNVWWVAIPVGGALGLLAGLIGIGGGVFLIPILLFFGWARTKEASAAGALFILANSLAGLMGHWSAGQIQIHWMWPLLLVVAVGGWLGGRAGSIHFSPVKLQRVFGGIILFVSWKIARTLF